MGYPSKITFAIGKLESVPGVMETITSADFNSRLINPVLTYNTEVDDEAAKYARGDHAEAESVFGARSAQLTFDVRVAWGGDAITEPDFYKFLKACGLSAVTYLDTGIGLQPLKSGDEKTCSFEFYQVKSGVLSPSAIRTRLAGACGTLQITAEKVGAPILAKFTFKGKLSGKPEQTSDIPVPVDMDQEHPDKFVNNTLYIGGKATKVSTFALDTGNDIQALTDQSDPTGYSHFFIAGRAPRFSCDPLIQDISNDDPIGDIVAGDTGMYHVDRIVLRSQHFRLCAPRAQMLPPSLAARDGLEGWNKNYKLLNNGCTGMLGDTGLPAEATFELLIGLHETGAAGTTGLYM